MTKKNNIYKKGMQKRVGSVIYTLGDCFGINNVSEFILYRNGIRFRYMATLDLIIDLFEKDETPKLRGLQ